MRWEVNEAVKLQQKLDAAKVSGIGVQITQQECEEFIYLRASGIKIAQLQADLAKAELLETFYLEGVEKSAAELDKANETIQEYKDALATKFNAEMCEVLKPIQAKLDKHRWIPVEERLPKRDGQVWICYKENGYTYGGYYNPTYKLWQIFDPCGGWSNIDSKSPPTHWKPIILPEQEGGE